MSDLPEVLPIHSLPRKVTSHPGWVHTRANLSLLPEEGKTFAFSYDIYLSNSTATLETVLRAWRIEDGKTCAYTLDLENPEMMAAVAADVLPLLSVEGLYEFVQDQMIWNNPISAGDTYHLAVARSGAILISEDFLDRAYHAGRKSALIPFAGEPVSNHEKIERLQENQALEAVANALLRFQMHDQILEDQHRIRLEKYTPK
jgi:hypothetical protein